MRTVWSALCWMGCLGAMCGCQSWSQIGQGIPNGARVAPPGTGSYNVPSSYYNGPKASTASAPAPTTTSALPANNGAVVPANAQLSTIDQLRSGINYKASAAINDATNRANEVVQASTSRAAATVQQYTDPAPSFGNVPPSLAGSNSQAISDNQPPIGSQAAPTKLDWQTPR